MGCDGVLRMHHVSKWHRECVSFEKGPQNDGRTIQPRTSEICGGSGHDKEWIRNWGSPLQTGCTYKCMAVLRTAPLIVRKSSTTNYVHLFGFFCKLIFKLKPRRYKLHEFAVTLWRITSIQWNRGDAFRNEMTDHVNAWTGEIYWSDIIWMGALNVLRADQDIT